ncbi:sodium channel protein type 4 subunit alpha B-like [Morone saxatilis]|uniref:sodium channel protein type 4 subunit alpha B-like n=1 Tax=Morone saxatilis TaxID=34816 RepID=UPI0015E20443|nr:sodium channel protein type 4 subunit alpha B-like [Morone saxatilis]
MSKKLSFFEFWRSKKERGAILERTNQLRLLPSQQKRLLEDSAVRAALQNVQTVSLLPPVGTEVFRRFTPAALEVIQQRQEAEKKEREKRKKNKEEAQKDWLKPARDLEAGKLLPFIYGDPPPDLLNTPLEELDPFYQSQKTFIVLSKGNIIHRFNAESSCYLLSPFNPLRTVATKILIHSLFSLFILVTILTNCVFMTISDPPSWIRAAEYVFTAVYTLETIIKVLSRGFCVGKFSFLRDPWNWLDIMVISMAFLTEFVYLGKYSVLSSVPRVLKIITVTPGLKTTVGAVVQSVKRLADVCILAAFCLSILALIGQQLFMGVLKQKCIRFMLPNLTDIGATAGYHDNKTGVNHFNFSEHVNDIKYQYFLPDKLNPLLCGNTSDAQVCPEGYSCLKAGSNPDYGYSSYDSIGWSLLALFRLMTRDWEDLVLKTLQAAGKSSLAFFILLSFPACFCILSLFVAVVAMATGEQEEAAAADARQKEEELGQIVEALRRREGEEQATCGAALSEDHNHTEGTQKSCSPCWGIFVDLFLKCDCCGCWRGLKRCLYTIVMNPFFDLGIVICLVLNTVVTAMEHFPMAMEFELQLSVAQLVFTAIFTAELVLRLVAMDPYGFFQVGWNIFDSIIVALNLLYLSVENFSSYFLLMRVFRLARWWPSFHLMLKTIWTTVRALRNPTILLVIMVFVFSMVGMQVFQKDYKDHVQICLIAADCQLPRWHLNDFFNSFLIIVKVLCGDWIETMWNCMEVSSQTTCLVFFIMVLVIGNLLVLNLFVVLLLTSLSDSLEAPGETKNNLQTAMSRINKSWILDHFWTVLGRKNHVNPDHTVVNGQEDNRKDYLALTCVTSEVSGNHGNQISNTGPGKVPITTTEIQIESKTPENEEKRCDNVQKHPEVQQDEHDEDDKGNTPEDCCSDKCYQCCPFLNIDMSQGGGRIWSNFRKACFFIIQHKYFNIFIILIILLSSAFLAFEDVYLPHRLVLKRVVETADQLFTYLFLLEMLLKWTALGLKKYFSDAWCWLDFLILDVFLVSMTADMLGFSGLGAIQSLRTLRALGPLRAVSRFQGPRVVVQVLVRSIPALFDWLLVSLTVWLIFSILGVNLFAGKFYHCFNQKTGQRFLPEQVNNYSQCLFLMVENDTEVDWRNTRLNYDNVASGYLSLLHLVSSADWVDIIYSAWDATHVESQPVYDSNRYRILYFISFFIIGSFFTFNYFIRVIVNNLLKEKIGQKHIFMTEEQQKYSKTIKNLFSKKSSVPRPQNQCQALLFDLVTRPCFEVVMVVLICLNIVALMVETDEQSVQKNEILYWIQFVFLIIFFIEFILKIIALRRYYFSDCRNVIDFVILIVLIMSLFFADIFEYYIFSPLLLPVLRLARIGRILHLIPCATGIQKLFLAFMMSLPALVNIALLILLIMFTFSIFGMFNFAYVKKEHMINQMFNFQTFGNSMICLFMTSAGLLSPVMSIPRDCDPDMENPGSTVRGDCGSPVVGIVFLTTYICLSFLLVVHLYIAVIMATFNSKDAEALCDDELQMFYKTWSRFDPDASQFIQYSQLSDFCDTLKDPLRIPKPNTIKLIHMDLPLFPGDQIHCMDVFLSLATQVVDDSGQMDSLKTRMEEKFIANSSKVSYEPISSTLRRKQEEVAATVIQRAYRKGLLQHRDTTGTVVESVNGGGAVSGSFHPE